MAKQSIPAGLTVRIIHAQPMRRWPGRALIPEPDLRWYAGYRAICHRVGTTPQATPDAATCVRGAVELASRQHRSPPRSAAIRA